MRKTQDIKFRTRKRDENPEEFRNKIQSDKYLNWIYSQITSSALNLLEIQNKSYSEYSILELGSSGGITNEMYPFIITSDIRESIGVSAMINGMSLPFRDESLDGIIAKDVLHHIPDPECHFNEILRTLKPGGKIIYIEPNWNRLSKFVFTYFHPEVFDSKQISWSRESKGPMDANQALAEIVFERDADKFNNLYPGLTVRILSPLYGLSYLLAGGVYNRSVIPSNILIKLGNIERKSKTWMKFVGLNRLVVIEKRTQR